MHDAGHHINLEIDRDTGQRDRVAQGNQLGGAFGTLDRRNPRNAENIALAGRTGDDQIQGFRAHQNVTGRPRLPMGLGLGTDVDHLRLTLRSEMAEWASGHQGHWCTWKGPPIDGTANNETRIPGNAW